MESQEQQKPALDHARGLAQHTGATVVLAWLVPVVASAEHFFTQIQVEPGSSGARRKAQGEAYLAQVTEEFYDAELAVVPKVVVTPLPPEQAILELVREEDADLVIMATLAESAVGRFLFGSVAEKVRRRASVPVLFVGASPAEEREV
jgi:nucleotide-binding universal stress UspA family protein